MHVLSYMDIFGFCFSLKAACMAVLMHAHGRQKLGLMYEGIQCLVSVPHVCRHATYPQTLETPEIVQIQRISPDLEQPSCSSSLLGSALSSNIKFGTEKVRQREGERARKSKDMEEEP